MVYQIVILNRYNKTMRSNFQINMPSIPSNKIKFKIQDIKTSAFGSQRNRFTQNKTFLTQKFVQSFHNFTTPPTPPLKDKNSQKDNEKLKERQSTRAHSQMDYRMMIPQQKKYMLHHYQKYKNYLPPPLRTNQFDRGFSFYKTDQTKPRPPKALNKTHNYIETIPDNTLTDNVYFQEKQEKKNEKQKEKPRVSCVFKNQTRDRIWSKMEKKIRQVPGPGAYLQQKVVQEKVAVKKPIKDEVQQQFSYKNLKKIITNIVDGDNPSPAQPTPPSLPVQKTRKDHMFIQDDRDRFGDQKYPIAHRVNVPGPGSYDNKNDIQGRVQKIMVVEEQRKLLKEWFNN